MAPTILSVSPSVGFTGGQALVEIRGTGFQTWTIPPFTGAPSPPIFPTVRVRFGAALGFDVAVVSGTRLFVRTPRTPLPIVKPSYGEGLVDVEVANLDPNGIPYPSQIATLANGFEYQRPNLSIETAFAHVTRTLVRLMRAQVIPNVSTGQHGDFDATPEDMLSVVDVGELPAIAIFGPAISESRPYRTHGTFDGLSGSNFEADVFNAPECDDLMYTFVGIADSKQIALGLQSNVRQFFKRNKWVFVPRVVGDDASRTVAYDLELLPDAPISFMPPPDEKSNLRSFSGTFVVRGFQHEALQGMPLSDRVARTHFVLADGEVDSPDPPLPSPPPPPSPPSPPSPSSAKEIVTFDFPFGVGVISNGAIAVSVPYGTDVSALTPIIVHTGVSVSPQSGVTVDFTNPVTYTVTAQDGTTTTYVVTVTVAAAPPTATMKIGTNFWYHTALADNWSGEVSVVPNIDWATAYGAGDNGLAATNIWNPAWLLELAPYSTLRFMVWENINWSAVTSWADRLVPTDPRNAELYIDESTTGVVPGMAYEWEIDLCNRLQKDYWVCVPAKADANYWTQLATLIRDKLSPTLRVYVEYSNETWNDTFGQKQYTIDQGVLANLPGMNQWYQGQSFAVLQSIRIFQAFENVFGTSAMGTRVIRVFSYGGNMDTGRQALASVYQSPSYNPGEWCSTCSRLPPT